MRNELNYNEASAVLLPAKAQWQSTTFLVDGKGKLLVTNTGGQSAGEGGMGSGNTDDREKGDLSAPGEKGGASKEDDGFDPIKDNVKEKERANKDDN